MVTCNIKRIIIREKQNVCVRKKIKQVISLETSITLNRGRTGQHLQREYENLAGQGEEKQLNCSFQNISSAELHTLANSKEPKI